MLHNTEKLSIKCNSNHLILVAEGVQCSNCLQLIIKREPATRKGFIQDACKELNKI